MANKIWKIPKFLKVSSYESNQGSVNPEQRCWCVLRGYFAESEGFLESELVVLLHRENLEIFRVSG